MLKLVMVFDTSSYVRPPTRRGLNMQVLSVVAPTHVHVEKQRPCMSTVMPKPAMIFQGRATFDTPREGPQHVSADWLELLSVVHGKI